MSSNEVKVGALTLGGIGLLAGIITFLGAFSFSGSGYKLQISYLPPLMQTGIQGIALSGLIKNSPDLKRQTIKILNLLNS